MSDLNALESKEALSCRMLHFECVCAPARSHGRIPPGQSWGVSRLHAVQALEGPGLQGLGASLGVLASKRG